MSLTIAVLTFPGYYSFTDRCIDSARPYADELLVIDDTECTGSGCASYNKAIEQASCTHLLLLDADNTLISQPPSGEADYTFADIHLDCSEWRYESWPTDWMSCLTHFVNTTQMPVPSGGVWKADFIRDNGLRWVEFESTHACSDIPTYVEWMTHKPTIARHPTPFLHFNQHPRQNGNIDIGKVTAERAALADRIRGIL